jgi:hypothetical protein
MGLAMDGGVWSHVPPGYHERGTLRWCGTGIKDVVSGWQVRSLLNDFIF